MSCDMAHTLARLWLLLLLALQCAGLHAELVFRSLEQADGQPRWSAVKKYSNPADLPSARFAGAAVPVEEVRVFVSGEITYADLDSAGVMAGLIRSGKQKLTGNTVWLVSNGGDIDAAMEVGRLLRKLGISTAVDKGDQCMSACVFAFMGGERRGVSGKLGIHRPYFPHTLDLPDRQAQFRHMEKVLKDYVEELDFPTSLYEAVMLVPPESIKILSAMEMKRFYLVGISPSTEDLVDAAAARRLDVSMFEYLKLKAMAAGQQDPMAKIDRPWAADSRVSSSSP